MSKSKYQKLTSKELDMIENALEAPASIIPDLGELLADYKELGSDPQAIVQAIKNLKLPSTTSVVDLACGKGAVAVEIARSLGYRVLGIELYEPFIADCIRAAQFAKVEDRCTFELGNIVDLAGTKEPVDIVIFAAVGDTIGSIPETMTIIRKYVKPGGYMVISDVYKNDLTGVGHTAFSYAGTKDQTVAWLTAKGDSVVGCYEPEPTIANDDARLQESIMKKALTLAKKHPEIEADLANFVESQKAENTYIEQSLTDVIWVIQKVE